MKSTTLKFLYCIAIIFIFPLTIFAQSTRQERRLINKGNQLYNERKFVEAQSNYIEALELNGASAEARYNLGLSQIRQVTNLSDTTAKTKRLIDDAIRNFSQVASMVKEKPGLAAKANYNLGNIEFNSKDFQKAIDYYKQALRIDPNDDKARKNLRIAQKNLQKENQNKENQDQKEEQKDKEDNKDQNKNQTQNQDQDQKQDQNKNQNKNNEISQQTAAQILQAIDNKESATRARVNKANKGEKSEYNNKNTRRW